MSYDVLNNFIKAIRDTILTKSLVDDSDGLLRISMIAKCKSARKFLYPELDEANQPDLKELAFHIPEKVPTGQNILIHPVPKRSYYVITAMRGSYREYLESDYSDNLSGAFMVQSLSHDCIILPEYGAVQLLISYSKDYDESTKYPWIEVMVSVKTGHRTDNHDQVIAASCVQSLRNFLEFHSSELKKLVPCASDFHLNCEHAN